MKVIISLMLLTSCVTPKNWSNTEHQDNMLMCRVTCDRSVKSYNPLTGECECYKRRIKR